MPRILINQSVLSLLLLATIGMGCTDRSQTEITVQSLVGTPSGQPCSLSQGMGRSLTPADTVLRIPPISCRVVASPALELSGSPDGSWPDPGLGMIAQDSRGRLYTGSGWQAGRGEVVVWDSDGKFIRTIGRLGQGPGEFPAGLLFLYVGHNLTFPTPSDSFPIITLSRELHR